MEGEGAGSYLQVHWAPLSHIWLVYGVASIILHTKSFSLTFSHSAKLGFRDAQDNVVYCGGQKNNVLRDKIPAAQELLYKYLTM